MTENTFNTEESNANINSPQYYVDDDGSFKFISPVISSSNFDGSVPVFEGSASVSDLISGMYLQINGTDFSPIVNISKDDPGLEDSATTDVSITYLDNQNEVQTAVYNSSDIVTVRYENWDEKYLGTQGWLLTYGGNAIFSNVGVRGDLEATTLDVGGSDGITYDGNTVTIGASVVINAPLTIGASGNFVVSGSAASDIVSSNTTITGANIATGNIKSALYSGPGTGSAFSTTGMLINLDDGSIASKEFRIDSSGNATFSGDLSAAGGTFSGNLSAAGGTFAGSLSAGVSISSPVISGGSISGNSISGGSITGTTITGSTLRTATSGKRVDIGSTNSNEIGFYNSSNVFTGTISGAADGLFLGGGTGITLYGTAISLYNSIPGTPVFISGGILNGNGSGLTTLNASNIASGTLGTSRLSGTYGINITGNASNITQYTVNQNLGTSANVTFNGGINSTGVYGNGIGGTGKRIMAVGSGGSIGYDSSTFKLKHDIQSITSDSIKINIPEEKISSSSDVIVDYTDVLKLTPVSFKWDVDNSSEVGLIAEEVKEILPIAYQEGEIPSYDRNMVMIMTLAVVKEQQKTIENLQNRVLQLESQLGVAE